MIQKANFSKMKGSFVDGRGAGNDGIRKVFSGKNVMIVFNEMKPADKRYTEIPTHSHPHEQLCYISKGKIKFKLGDEVFDMEDGDIVLVPPNVLHGAVLDCDDTVLGFDIFSPIREDYLPKDE